MSIPCTGEIVDALHLIDICIGVQVDHHYNQAWSAKQQGNKWYVCPTIYCSQKTVSMLHTYNGYVETALCLAT